MIAGVSPFKSKIDHITTVLLHNAFHETHSYIFSMECWYFGHLMQRSYPLEKTWCYERLRAGGEGGNRRWDGWTASLTQRHESKQTPGDSEGWGSLVCSCSWHCKEMDMTSWVNHNGGHGSMWCGFLSLRPNPGLYISLTHSSFYCVYQTLNALTLGICKALPSTQITCNLLPLFFFISLLNFYFPGEDFINPDTEFNLNSLSPNSLYPPSALLFFPYYLCSIIYSWLVLICLVYCLCMLGMGKLWCTDQVWPSICFCK